MAIGFLAVAVLLRSDPTPAQHSSLIEPLRALRHPGLLTLGLTALLYNMGFFALLAYAPYPMHMDAHGLGLVFFGWGVGLALTSVFAAPWLERRVGRVRTNIGVLVLLALDMAAMAVFVSSPTTLAVAVIVAGLLLGVNNTLITEAVMKVSPVERPVASAGYSFIRFTGGAIAPSSQPSSANGQVRRHRFGSPSSHSLWPSSYSSLVVRISAELMRHGSPQSS